MLFSYWNSYTDFCCCCLHFWVRLKGIRGRESHHWDNEQGTHTNKHNAYPNHQLRTSLLVHLKLEIIICFILETGAAADENIGHWKIGVWVSSARTFCTLHLLPFFFILLMRHCVIQYSVLLLVFFCISVCVASSWHTTLCCCYYVSKYSPEWRLNTQWSHTTHTQQKTTDNVMTSFHVIFGGFKITAFVVNVLCLNKHETAEFVQQASRMRMECACYNSSVKNVNFRHIMIVAGFRSVLDSATSANGFEPNIPM